MARPTIPSSPCPAKATRNAQTPNEGTDPRAGDARVVVLTTFDADEYVYEALAAGASGFLLKDGPG